MFKKTVKRIWDTVTGKQSSSDNPFECNYYNMATGAQTNMDTLSDELFDVLCSMCKNKDKSSEGEKFCVDCHDYFCRTCVQVHKEVPVLAGHKVLDKSQVTSRTSERFPRAPAEKCDRHSHKHIDMYCPNHDNVGCSTCMAVDHRLCKDTFYIPELLKTHTYLDSQREVQTKLREITKVLMKQADRFKQDKETLLKRKVEILADIRRFRQEINDLLDKLENSSIDEIESKVKCIEEEIDIVIKQLQANKSMITSANDKLASTNTNQPEVFAYVKMAEDTANVANKYIKDAKLKSTLKDVYFQFDRTILTQLEQKKTLGTLSGKPIKMANTLFQIKGEQSCDVKVHSDKGLCNIRSICCMEDGTIIVANNINRKLKWLHSYYYTVSDHCDLPGEPWQVCMINNTQIAVTVPSKKEIHFISLIGRKMKTVNMFNTDFECHGLAYSNNSLYISDSQTSVYMYTLSGRMLNQFSKDQFGQKLYSSICSLAVSQDATRIYVADYNNGLIVLDNDGQVISLFNDRQLKGATCCYFTEAGGVLVSGLGSNNVLQFTSDGELMGEVIKDDRRKGGISSLLMEKIVQKGILSVCCNQQMTKICISRLTDENIVVYDISSVK